MGEHNSGVYIYRKTGDENIGVDLKRVSSKA
jgi:hypothetical protein